MKGSVIALYIIVTGLILFFFGTMQLLITYGDIKFDQTVGQAIDQTYIIFLMFGPVILVVGLIFFVIEKHKESKKQS